MIAQYTSYPHINKWSKIAPQRINIPEFLKHPDALSMLRMIPVFTMYIALIFYLSHSLTLSLSLSLLSLSLFLPLSLPLFYKFPFFYFFSAYIDFTTKQGRVDARQVYQGVNYTEPEDNTNITMIFNGDEVPLGTVNL